jgi:predicted O-methyltransferase YrrM
MTVLEVGPGMGYFTLPMASYMAMLRFTLIDRKTRVFVAERFCFRGSVDDWIPIAGPGTLAAHVRRFVKHLGRESFYELF